MQILSASLHINQRFFLVKTFRKKLSLIHHLYLLSNLSSYPLPSQYLCLRIELLNSESFHSFNYLVLNNVYITVTDESLRNNVYKHVTITLQTIRSFQSTQNISLLSQESNDQCSIQQHVVVVFVFIQVCRSIIRNLHNVLYCPTVNYS